MHRKFRLRLLMAGAVVSAAVAGLPAVAGAQEQSQPPAAATAPAAKAVTTPVIVVVDVDQILQESAAAKSVRSQADKYQQSFQEQISKEESTLRSNQQEIEQERKTMAPDAFAEKARAFETKVAEFQSMGMARRRAFDKSVSVAMGHVQQAMLEATQQIAVSHGANIVLPRSQVLLFDDKMNITKEIIGVMDTKLTHVDFPVPKVEAEPSSGGAAGAGGSAKKKTH